MRPEEKTPQQNKTTNTDGQYNRGGTKQIFPKDCDKSAYIEDKSIRRLCHRRRGLSTMSNNSGLRRLEQLGNAIWIDGLIYQEPWQDYNYHDWEETTREIKNFATGILFLLVVRRILFRVLRTRYRSHAMN
mmetsp:Transcript_11896/g.34127  ORF Transcript_11896/g.34127 Transcript_11896/m.34127 type:complete len:131 (-) Transcript_11896:1760-2152(-)